MLKPETEVGCPFFYDLDPSNLRQCQKFRGHGGGHQWNGPDGFYVKWTEKVTVASVPAEHKETPA